MKHTRPLVPNPCHEDWDKLTPEERGHFCTVCETKVWDLSSLTKAEADEFLRSTQGDLCVSYRERDGQVLHREAPVVPLGRLVRRLPAAAGFSLALAACTPTGQGAQQGSRGVPTEPSKPEPVIDEPKPDEPVPTTAVVEPDEDVPEPVPVEPEEPEERHVKGKWAPEDDPNLNRDKGDKPTVKKGKVARPD